MALSASAGRKTKLGQEAAAASLRAASLAASRPRLRLRRRLL